jgi:hypothetical protein
MYLYPQNGQVNYLHKDCEEAVVKFKTALRAQGPHGVDLPLGADAEDEIALTLPEGGLWSMRRGRGRLRRGGRRRPCAAGAAIRGGGCATADGGVIDLIMTTGVGGAASSYLQISGPAALLHQSPTTTKQTFLDRC